MLPAIYGAQEKCIQTPAQALTNGNTLFTITGGPIQIMSLMAVCTVTNSGTGTTLQWSSTPAVGTAATISGASASLTSCVPGATVLLTPTALSTAPTIVLASAGGVQLGLVAQNHIIVLDGIITMVTATVLTTARWYFVLRYVPLTPSSVVN